MEIDLKVKFDVKMAQPDQKITIGLKYDCFVLCLLRVWMGEHLIFSKYPEMKPDFLIRKRIEK
jgi:hypothetical protein